MYDFSFVFQKNEPSHVHTDIEFFYVIDGTANFTLENKQYKLNREDFLVVNVDKSHSYTAEGDFLAACVRFSYSELCSLMKQSMVFFWCNSAMGNNEACDELRRIFKKIISEEYTNQGKDIIYLNALFYEFLHVLTSDFLLNKESAHYSEETHKFDARKHEIAEFIQMNFDKPISLEDLSKQMFLSYAYLSKYIKRHFGMGFAEYLNQVRLNFAVSQLLHSDLSIVRIAMESGFASSAALNKAFKQTYNMTPTEYRRQWGNHAATTAAKEESDADVREMLARHFDKTRKGETERLKQPSQTVVLQNTPKRLLKRNWCKMINMGTAADLLQSDVQNHLLILKQELNFEYVRFWDLYSEQMQMGDAKTGYTFSKLDQVIDFLLRNGMKPYMELRPKPKLVLKSPMCILQFGGELEENPIEEVRQFTRKLFIHLLNRYNTETVESWYFELWHSEAEHDIFATELPDSDSVVHNYLDRFDAVASEIRELCPDVRLGGGGFSPRFGAAQFRKTLQEWTQHAQQPNFISLYCYPYTMYSLDKVRNQSRNVELLRHNLEYARMTMNEVGFDDLELHVSEWNFSISSRNILNDNCMKGAYLVRDIMDSLDYADIMGYWVGSDLYSAHSDTSSLIYGGGGLLSRDGIRKPAFYAFDFMNHLGRYLRKKEDNCIITDNGAGNWRIVCHNLKALNHQYSLVDEGDIPIEEQNNLFEDLKKRTIHFSLPGKRGEKYILKYLTVNRYSGSLQDEWVSMSGPEEMTRDEIKYLSRIVTPRMVVKTLTAEGGKLNFDVTMEPNEIAYIHVIYQYS